VRRRVAVGGVGGVEVDEVPRRAEVRAARVLDGAAAELEAAGREVRPVEVERAGPVDDEPAGVEDRAVEGQAAGRRLDLDRVSAGLSTELLSVRAA